MPLGIILRIPKGMSVHLRSKLVQPLTVKTNPDLVQLA